MSNRSNTLTRFDRLKEAGGQQVKKCCFHHNNLTVAEGWFSQSGLEGLGPAGPKKKKKGKTRKNKFDFFCLAKCTILDQKKSKHVNFRQKKSLRTLLPDT